MPVEEAYFVVPQVANKYDSYIGINIPFYWSSLNFIADRLGDIFGDAPIKCVELGSGTANLCITVGRKLRLTELMLVDHSEAFLGLAKKKLAETPLADIELSFRHSSFLSENWEEGIPLQSRDLIMSSLTLDHIAEDENFLALLKKLHGLLAPGGCFVLCEKSASPDEETPSWQSFSQMIHIRGEHNLRNGLKTQEEIDRWKVHNFTEDIMRPLSQLWSLAEEAGFEVAVAGGTELPQPDQLDYDRFYGLNQTLPLTREHVFSRDAAYGTGILICRKA